ncbi:MAG: PP2C family protein-serine/threonine phosphatase [Deltaproteobacteria bacterium]|jgi:sigma-B regulation protein RsbU (phosphoserine phosphatase)|nr:PP2C family protein-serine/threonine phosphatase [Deltaproteobacteria bacterium]
MSFRLRVSLLLVAGVLLTVFPYAYFAWKDFAESSIASERLRFQTLAAVTREDLRSSYESYIIGQVFEIVRQKESLRKISLLSARYLQHLYGQEGSEAEAGRAAFLGFMEERGVKVGVFRLRDDPLSGSLDDLARTGGSSEGEDSFWEGISDFSGRSLARLLSASEIPQGGRFTVLRARDGDGAKAYLAFIAPDANRRVAFVNLESLAEIKESSLFDDAFLVGELQRRLPTLPIGAGSHAMVLDGEGTVLARAGAGPRELEGALSPELLSLALSTKDAVTEEMVDLPPPLGRTLVRIEWFKALDWRVVLATPASTLTAPARQMARRVVAVALGVAAMSVLLGLSAAHIVTRALSRMTARAAAAGDIDFTDPQAHLFFEDQGLSARSDEIGDLSRAFDKMGLDLAKNIQKRMEATLARERVLGELAAAREIQEGILPPQEEAPREGLYRVAPFLRPAKEVGGDFYDFFTAPCGRRCVAIGDVAGKGAPAALFMVMVATLTRRNIHSGLSPEKALEQLNRQLNERNPNSMFATLFLGLFDPETGALIFANGGHPPPLAARGGEAREIGAGRADPLVGAWPDLRYRLQSATLAPGEICLLYTDGVTEAQNADGAFFGRERLLESVRAATLAGAAEARETAEGPEGIIDAVNADLAVFRGEELQSDDITMLAFQATRARFGKGSQK